MNKPIKNKLGFYEYKGMRISRTGDKNWKWRVSLGLSILDKYEFQTVAGAAAFIDNNAK